MQNIVIVGASLAGVRAAETLRQIRIYKADEMEADHVTAWSKGGQSDLDNCELLCIAHNRAKGNR